jgi:PAS domain S-box-containing protein/putative nucleotidyltransferase with HDIG domain
MNPTPRILIVEDDAVLVMNLQVMLTRMGYQVAGMAATGEAAVRTALEQQPDIILMDIYLRGEMNGIQAAEAIHQQAHIPVVYLTAFSDETLLQQAKATDAYAYLAKPVRERELRASLEMVLFKNSTEQRLRHLNQVLRAVRDVNQLITREHDTQRLMTEAARILLRTRGYRFVWIGESAGTLLRMAAQAGEGSSLMEKFAATTTREHRQRLPGAVAFHTGQVAVCHDMLHDDLYTPCREEVERLQFQSTLAVPMKHQEDVLGVLIVYADQTSRFDDEEIDLLCELADDIAFGLVTIRQQGERERAEMALRESEALFRAVVEHNHDGIVFMDADRRFIYVSPSYAQLNGRTPGEMIGQSGSMLVHPDDIALVAEKYHEVLQQPGFIGHAEYRIQHQNGSWRWIDSNMTNFLDDPHVRAILLNSHDITERKLFEDAIQQRNNELTVLNQIGQALSRLNKPDQILELIVSETGRVLDNRNLFIALYDPASQELSFPVYIINGERVKVPGRPLGNDPIDHVIQNNAPLLVRQNLNEAIQQQAAEGSGDVSRCIIAVPMRADNQVIGVIALQDYDHEKAYDDHTIELLTTIAAQATNALENARLYGAMQQELEERKQREHELQVIATLSASLRAALTRAEMMPVIVQQIVGLLGCDTVDIEVIDQQTGDALLEAGQGLWERLVGTRQKKGTGMNAIISQTLQPYLTQDMENDPNVAVAQWAREGIRGAAGMPLIAQEKLIGFIWVGCKGQIAENEVRLLSAITNITANAIARATLHEQTQKQAADLTLAYDSTLQGWARTLELRDQETKEHTQRVVEMTLILARRMGVKEEDLEYVRRGALLHDIGKLGIPDSVLLKPGTLDEREWEIMRRHAEYALNLLSPVEYLRPAINIPYCHHEKWDGTGYPRGLKGEDIPLEARIFAVVDVWDALTNDRPYRRAWSEEDARKYIRQQSGKHFDPWVVEAFLAEPSKSV